MLIKIGISAVINMTAFDKVYIESGGEKLAVVVSYKDFNEKEAEYKLTGLERDRAIEIKNEIASQISELEMATASTLLENAIISGGKES